ncbi:MAG: vitamin B12 dependent-methionine synthase activation domain-containing protein [Acidobacteriota bacterium]
MKSQGISEGKPVPEKISALVERAMDLAAAVAKPVGLKSKISIEDFDHIYRGEGQNEPDTPLEHIFPQANRLALFAVTLGSDISKEIEMLFKRNNFALASMLDAVASLAADRAVGILEACFLNDVFRDNEFSNDALQQDTAKSKNASQASSSNILVLSYSPGYCGWHVSGQKKIFAYLRPERIGISLNESCLMIPLKSVTGVLIAGPSEIHVFEPCYPFCRLCKDRTCLERGKNIQ